MNGGGPLVSIIRQHGNDGQSPLWGHYQDSLQVCSSLHPRFNILLTYFEQIDVDLL